MAFQPSVAEYFNSRKRPAVDESKKITNPAKVVILESLSGDVKKSLKSNLNSSPFVKKIVYKSKELKSSVCSLKHKNTPSNKLDKNSVTKGKKCASIDGTQLDIRKSLFKTSEKKNRENESRPSQDSGLICTPPQVGIISTKDNASQKSYEPTVPFHIKGALSPAKLKNIPESVLVEEKVESKNDPQDTSKACEKTTSNSRKELNLGNIKAMMSRSSRLEEMKAALKRFNEKKAKLNEEHSVNVTETPILRGSEVVNLDATTSALKTPRKMSPAPSPKGKLTPCRLFDTPPPALPPSPIKSPLKSPTFQRYQALVTEGRPALVLPFKYRALAEQFRCIDTVASMLHNRRETITLSKLKPGVQEISRRNLTEYDLGQIKTIFPNAFEFTMEKIRTFGSSEKYELVISPQLKEFDKGEETEQGADKHVMKSPSVLLSRRRVLYNALLELTKDYHEEFLSSLEPPMRIPRSRLTRWHPEFAVDDVPDILSAALPQPPNVERVTTAKDVLERARNLFVVNPRMERALQKVSENCAAPKLTFSSSSETLTPAVNKPALHGVPASLLERVRAKQAARALEAMTRTPAQAKEAVRLTRLPEIARIVRNLFVAEKKSVLPRELVLQKLGDSYRESLTQNELDDHLKLLAEKTPGWLVFCNLRKTDFVKLSRSADMSRIMNRLEALAAEKCV